MTKLIWNVIKFSPVVLAATFFAANSAFASETSVASLSQEANIGQVTSVSQFSDVQPTDWAFQALQSLVERYGCIAGYPNGTYRGNRAMTRYEFAAGLNACLDQMSKLIATTTADLATKEDLAAAQRLQEEFASELEVLRGRIDGIEIRTAELEANQFSTTTKLAGEVIFNVTDTFGDRAAVGSRELINNAGSFTSNTTTVGPSSTARLTGRELDSNATFSHRVRLNLNSSFNGRDILNVRLQARNTVPNDSIAVTDAFRTPGTGSAMTRLSFDGGANSSAASPVEIDKINYTFNPSAKLRVRIDASNGEFYGNINNFNPELSSDARGSISRYGRFSPIYRLGAGGAGATATYRFSDKFTGALGYLSRSAANPADKNGLFDGNYAAIAQLDFKPSNAFNLGLTYARTYNNSANANLTDSTGSNLANQPFGTIATAANHYGVQANFRANDKLVLGGWVGFADVEAQANGSTSATTLAARNAIRTGDNADLFYWAANLAVRDFGKEGNVLGFTFGQPPKVTSSDFKPEVNFTGVGTRRVEQKDADTSYHLEALYRMQLTDRISVTPGLLVIFNPEHNDRNDTIYVGTLRTTFTF